jgi:hypothetical protein
LSFAPIPKLCLVVFGIIVVVVVMVWSKGTRLHKERISRISVDGFGYVSDIGINVQQVKGRRWICQSPRVAGKQRLDEIIQAILAGTMRLNDVIIFAITNFFLALWYCFDFPKVA